MLELLIILSTKQLCVVDSQVALACYEVAIGHASTPTPVGKFEIERVVHDPIYVDWKTGKQLGAGILGAHAIVTNLVTPACANLGLDCKFAIHGTNQLESVGQSVSGGCIRMRGADIEHLYYNYLHLITRGEIVETH